MTSSSTDLDDVDGELADTSNRIETANNRIESIKRRIEALKRAAEQLRLNATNIRELDVGGEKSSFFPTSVCTWDYRSMGMIGP